LTLFPAAQEAMVPSDETSEMPVAAAPLLFKNVLRDVIVRILKIG
jgi:hypothetical protein